MKALFRLRFGALALLSAFTFIPAVAQTAHVNSSDHVAIAIGHVPDLAGGVHHTNFVEKVARHCAKYLRDDGMIDIAACNADPSTVFYREASHNLLTNAGKDAIASQEGNTATQAAACNYIALTNTAITPAAGDTTLSGEITLNGLARAQAAYAHTNGTSTYTLTKTFTATGTQASQAAGVFNASSSGTMCFENTYTQVTLNNTDTLTVTWTITLS